MTASRHQARRIREKPSAGDRSREHLLEVAGEVFAEEGYGRATSKEICERAGMNAAAVNYHFGGIDALYGALLVRAHRHFMTLEALREIDESDLGPQDKLRAYLMPLVQRLAQLSAKSWELRLLSREIVSPSPLREAFFGSEIRPKLEIMRGIVAQLIGARPEEAVVGRAILTVVAPCLLLALANRTMLQDVLPSLADPASEIGPLIDHYQRFILAGLEAVALHHRSQQT
jgi:AcrR family transcriptional regulator